MTWWLRTPAGEWIREWICPRWRRHRWKFFWLAAAVLGASLIIWVIWYPDAANGGIGEITDANNRLERRTAFRTILVQVLLGLGILVGAVYAARRYELSSKEHELERDKAASSDFTKAVELLASAKVAERLGGIYALGRIAQTSERDHWTIMQVLTAWLRDESPEKVDGLGPIREDFRAVAEVMRERRYKQDSPSRFSLSGVDLRHAPLGGAHLERAILVGAHLERADLKGAFLKGAYLTEAHLYRAILVRADLVRAILVRADLEGADLAGADLRGAILERAILTGANLRGAQASRMTRWPDGFDPEQRGVVVDSGP